MNQQYTTGLLLVNTGTPDAPTKDAVVQYLGKFLMDRRIVSIPPLIWKPILNGIVLKARPRKTVSIYQHIWTPEGSPYTLSSQAIEVALQQEITQAGYGDVLVRMAHRYGNPSMEAELRNFKHRDIGRVIAMPLYPQYAFATTGSVQDELARQLTALDYHPQLDFIEDYHDNQAWVEAVADSIAPFLAGEASVSSRHLVFSFHSEPLKDLRNGDPYKSQTEHSGELIASRLGLEKDQWTVAYQSRFDDTQRWLGPYLSKVLDDLRSRDIHAPIIVCPGFAVDCTETLYDIDFKLGAELKYVCEGDPFTYVPCLNASPAHIAALRSIASRHLK